jgi:hypothetical protein
VLDKLDRRMRFAVVGRHYGVSRVTVQFIKKSQDKIKECVKTSVISSAKISFVSYHDPFLKKYNGPCVYSWKILQRNI